MHIIWTLVKDKVFELYNKSTIICLDGNLYQIINPNVFFQQLFIIY